MTWLQNPEAQLVLGTRRPHVAVGRGVPSMAPLLCGSTLALAPGLRGLLPARPQSGLFF